MVILFEFQSITLKLNFFVTSIKFNLQYYKTQCVSINMYYMYIQYKPYVFCYSLQDQWIDEMKKIPVLSPWAGISWTRYFIPNRINLIWWFLWTMALVHGMQASTTPPLKIGQRNLNASHSDKVCLIAIKKVLLLYN